jgi:hypothetical protein
MYHSQEKVNQVADDVEKDGTRRGETVARHDEIPVPSNGFALPISGP